MGRMDKSREGERGEKSHAGLPPGMDPATAALYANMFGSGSLGGFNPAASGLPGWGGLPPGFPPTSSAAGLASLAAAQQAQQAAVLAGLGPAAAAYQDRALGAWWNLAGLQQMELLARLQGGLGGSGSGAVAAAAGMGAYGGLHPEHLMNLEILQAQHAAAMAAALSTSKAQAASTSSKVPHSSKNGSGGSGSKGITSTLSYRGGASTTTTTYSARTQEHLSNSSRPGLEISRLAASSTTSSSTPSSSSSLSFSSSSHHPLHSSSSSSSLSGRPPPYPYGSASTSSISHRYSSPGGLDNIASSHHSDTVGSSPSLSYGIASLIADKHPSSSSSSTHPKVHSSSSSSLTASSIPSASSSSGSSSSTSANNSSQAERVAEKLAGNGSVSISKAIRNKELEIIPISPSVKGGSGAAHGSVPPHRDKSEPKVSISTVAAAARLSNGVPGGAAWREESASVSIEPCGPAPPMPPGPTGSTDDAPLNLSMKTEGIKAVKVGEKRDHKDSQLGSLGLGRAGVAPLDFPPGLGPGLGSVLTPSLEVLQSLYGGQQGEPRNVLASMQEALQRQLLGADGKRDEKKKRLQMEDVQDRSRHLGRGTSKPKKNTVASLLEQCRAAGIKPSSLPLPPTTSIVATSATTSPPLHGMSSSRPGDSLSITTSPIFNSSPTPSPASQSLPPTLLPGLPLGLSSASSSSYPSSVGSPAPPTPIPTPPVPSLSISTVVTSSSSSSAPPSPLPPSEPTTTTATTTTTTVSSSTTTTTTTASSVAAPPSPPPSSTPTPTTTAATTILPPQPASPPSTPASVTASPPPPQSTPTSVPLPVSLPPSLSLSSSVSITSVTPEAAVTSTPTKPSVTVHPTTSTSETTPDQEYDKMDNSVDILEVTRMYPHQNGGEKPIKKRHMITSSSVDGRLITTIKAAAPSGAPDSSELSDSESDDESTSMSSVDDDAMNHLPSPWLKRDTPDSASAYSESPPVKKRKMITDEVSLRVPLMYGWRRETTMRTITQSGVRGEVVYYAPCGKPFRQYPDIMRYLEKNGITEVTRDNFSFSSKIPIGEYLESGTQMRHTEGEIRDKIKQIREQKGYKPQRRHEDGRDALEIEAEAILRRLEAEEEAEKARKDLMSQLEEQHQLRIQKEQERVRKQEELRREKEELRRQREEENRQRLYEQLRKAQEREQEKQKQKILKEQLYLQELNKQREMLYTLELERERRRYHGVLVRALEGRKRHEERERRREEMKEEKRATRERKREERLQARELNQLMKEVKEDMELTDHTPLPDAPRLQGLRLPPEAFGNILMVFEFLHNFGETLGFDMESLPSIQSLQMALLNDTESEEELLSVLSHLLVCAIEDPGIPSAHRHTTILGQTLNRADITHANISEILRVYLNANAMGEVRIIYGLMGTEKERRENPKKGQEWDARLSEMDAYKMGQWLLLMPFLALNPTQKSEIVAYVCNELLQNKAVVRQIEDSLDRHNGLKTEKWKLDTRIRKLRMSVARKRIYNAAMRSMMEHRGGEDSNMSSVSSCHGGEQDKADAKKDKEEDKLEEDEEDEENESGNDSDNNLEEIPDEEDDKRLNADDASKTLDILQRQMNQVRQDLFETAQQVRGFNCGQDRYQRTMWVLPHAGGPFLEGLSSCDYTGRQHFPLTMPTSAAKDGLTQEELEARLTAAREEKERKLKEEQEAKKEVKEEPVVKEEKVEVKTEVEVKAEKEEEAKEGEAGDVKPPVPLLQVKKEEDLKEEDDGCDVPDIPRRGDRKSDDASGEESRAPRGQNGITENKDVTSNILGELYPPMLGANLSPYLVNGLKEAPPPPPNAGEGIDPNLLALGLGLVPGQYLRPEHVAQREKLAFNLLPRIPCDVSSMESLPSGQTPHGTPRGSPREASPCSRYNGPHSPRPGTPHGPSITPGTLATPASTVNTPLAVSTPKPTATAPSGVPGTPNTATNTTEVGGSQETTNTPDVTATPDPALGTPGNTATDVTNTTDLTSTTLGQTGTPAPNSTPGGPANTPGGPPNTPGAGVAPSDGAAGNTPGGIQSLPHKELLERLHQTAEALPIPGEYKTGWWHLGDMEQLKQMIGALNERGVRERELKRFIEKNFSIVKNAISKIDTDATNLDTDPEEAAKVVYDEYGTPVADEPQHWLPDVALKVDFAVLESVYAMEEKITNASMQSKSWRLSDNGERQVGEFRASCLEPVDDDDSRLNPIHVGRERLLALEEGIERRYLKPPLGVPMNPKSDAAPDTKEVPKGLQVWREAVGRTETAAQLAMCTYMLETAVAWDKSIMKAYCQFCHSGDHEEKLLLCDGCDKGYHTHCFKPPMNNIPDGDWYCYECVNKFSDTSQRHCLVCGGTEGRTLVHCSVCPRAYHTTCITPNLTKVPRNKWVCPACTSKSPRGRRGRAKKVSESNNTSSAAQPPDATPDATDEPQGAVSPAVTKKDRAIKKKDQKDLLACKSIVMELEVHEDAWPFLLPVNTRQFPTYKKIIRRPMDLSVIKKKLEDNQYKSREEYCEDLRLMFNNCETFNEDDSPVGKAGHNLRSFFETRWNEHFPPS